MSFWDISSPPLPVSPPPGVHVGAPGDVSASTSRQEMPQWAIALTNAVQSFSGETFEEFGIRIHIFTWWNFKFLLNHTISFIFVLKINSIVYYYI